MKLSINTTFVNNEQDIDSAELDSTFENLDVTKKELAILIRHSDKFAYAPWIKKSPRCSSNFSCSGFLTAYIDGHTLLRDMLKHDYIKSFASFIYTTPDHTEEDNKYRVVFELEEDITDEETMKHAASGISKKLGCDPICLDASRMYYGSRKSKIHHINKTLPAREVRRLTIHGRESHRPLHSQDTKSSKDRSTIISRYVIDPEATAIVEYGTDLPLQDLLPRTKIRCPFHIPDNGASAFILKSTKGTLGVHCLVCKTTFFTTNDIPVYNFNYDLNNLRRLEGKSRQQDIVRINQKYLSNYDATGNLIFVRSPKGSGKTVWLENVAREKDDAVEHMLAKMPKPNKASKRWNGAILIGHRRSLITSLSDRLQLKPYIEHAHIYKNRKYIVEQKFNYPQPYYAICADSLSILVNTEYHWWPIVIIDEVEQVLKHLTSDTLKYRRNNTFQVFKYIINSARKVYLMDSDLNELTVESIYQLIDDKQNSVSVTINSYKVEDRTLNLYDNRSHLESELVKSIENNKRCYVCSNSKKKIIKLTALLETEFGDSKKILSITSNNSHEQDIQSFIRNISTEILNYDVVLSSPTLGTGIDITFDDDKQEIDCVYGIFEQRVNTHFDIDQQLSRVRNPKQVNVWVSPEKLRFETNPTVIKREMEESHAEFRNIVKINSDGTKEYNDDEYLNLYSNVKSQQLASKNYLAIHFAKLRRYNGWAINEIEADEDDLEEIKAMKARVEATLKKQNMGRLMIAKVITKDEYRALSRASDSLPLIDDQLYAMRRYAIESFYLQHIDEELIALDDDGTTRRQLREFELLMSNEEDIKASDVLDEEKSITYPDRRSRLHKKKLYKNILIKSKLMDNSLRFNTINPIKKTDLVDFVKYIKANRQSVERLFEIDIRRGVDKNPVQQLKRYLQRLGIFMDPAVPKKRPDRGKDYLYTLNQECILFMNDMNTKRNDKSITYKWHDERNKTTKNRLFPEWDPDESTSFYNFICDQIQEQILDDEIDDYQ